MTDLERRVNEALKSKSVQSRINKEATTNKNFCSGGTEKIAKQYAEKMRTYLSIEARNDNFISETTGEYFLDHVLCNVEFKTGIGWIANVYFDEDAVTRNSLSNRFGSIYLPALLSNSWSSSPAGKVWGYDKHGTYVVASDKYMDGDFKGFIFRAVEKFKQNVDDTIQIEVSDIYK